MMDEQRFKSIAANTSRPTAAEVVWLCQLVIQLQTDYAEEVARAIKAEEEIERLNSRLATANHKVVAWSRKVVPG